VIVSGFALNVTFGAQPAADNWVIRIPSTKAIQPNIYFFIIKSVKKYANGF
jgi:hypothetical protein